MNLSFDNLVSFLEDVGGSRLILIDNPDRVGLPSDIPNAVRISSYKEFVSYFEESNYYKSVRSVVVLNDFSAYTDKQQYGVKLLIEKLENFKFVLDCSSLDLVIPVLKGSGLVVYVPPVTYAEFSKKYYRNVSSMAELEVLYRITTSLGSNKLPIPDIRRHCMSLFRNSARPDGFQESYCLNGIFLEDFVLSNDLDLIVKILSSLFVDKFLMNTGFPVYYNTDLASQMEKIDYRSKLLTRRLSNLRGFGKRYFIYSKYLWLRGVLFA